MSAHAKILNLSSGLKIKRSQALKRVQNCISAWVEPNRTIRDLTLAESIALRSDAAHLAEPLPMAEIPGVHYKPQEGKQSPFPHALIRQANMLASQLEGNH